MNRATSLLATRNAGKLLELHDLFAQTRYTVVDVASLGIEETAAESVIESYATFEENALAKARYFHALTGMPTFADDSGLAVVPLDCAPGVISKRWSGRIDLSGAALDAANNEKLCAEIARAGGYPAPAAFVCAAAFVDGSRELVQIGRAEGEMIPAPRGEKGFGYDAYFFSRELQKTYAEASVTEKREVSHRGRAFARLLARLEAGASEQY